jgi:4-amino-4-deoxy-L-arabinose transferase-like glycosyltransferase
VTTTPTSVEGPPAASSKPRLAAPRPRRWLGRVPLACVVCALVAFLNGVVWAYLTPAFQIPDEPVHIGYSQYIAETGKVPRVASPYYAPTPDAGVAFLGVPWSLTGKPNWSAAKNRVLERQLAEPRRRVQVNGAGYVANYPPLYYAYEAIPYRIVYGSSFYDRMFAMRVASALLAAFTVAFTFLFLRELLPGTPWAWTVGALAVAFQPVFGFISGGVNPDNMLWTASAALFYFLARAFRRGLTPRLGLGLGLATVAGLLSKPTMFAMLPGIAFAVIVLLRRSRGARFKQAALGAGVGVGALAIPWLGWQAAANDIWHRIGGTGPGGAASPTGFNVRQFVSYVWQFYLPRLPWMKSEFPYPASGYPKYPTYPLWQTYFEGFVGRFGWFEYGFPLWFNLIALALAAVVLGLAIRTLIRRRAVVRARLGELLTYVLLTLGAAGAVNLVGYRYRAAFLVNFEQPRYLFLLLPLYAALVALAARGAGRRWGPAVGVAFVVLAAGHSIAAQLLTVARYYA